MKSLHLLLFVLIFYSCSKPGIQVSDLSNTGVGTFAANEMVKYLDHLYDRTDFFLVENGGNADIQYLLSSASREPGTSGPR